MVALSKTPRLADDFAGLWQTALVNKRTAGMSTVHRAPLPYHGAGFAQFPFVTLWAIVAVAPIVPVLALGYPVYPYYFVSLLIFALPVFSLTVFNFSATLRPPTQPDIPLPNKPVSEYMEIKDAALKAQYGDGTGNKIPMEVFFEAYVAGKIDIKGDVLEVLEQRHDFASFRFTWGQFKFFITQWIPETLWHSRAQDEDQVKEHYDRGNDFYGAFLGPRMVYTSGLVSDPNRRESLEELQDNKLEKVCREFLDIQPGDKHLDIGCGWGSLLVHAAKFYGSTSTGVTLAKNQVEFGTRRADENGVKDRVNFLHMDYRDIPAQKFNKISCLEMAEHVGVRLFPTFLKQVWDMLEDDGIFYLQIAGLRRPWTFEDLIWGLFMARYVFPGADASLPLAWVIGQVENAGFEVREVETVGVHYSATIERWYYNWQANRAQMAGSYGESWARIWEIFLGWSTIISRQGSATCYQIVLHKNTNKFDRSGLMRGVKTAAQRID